MSEDSVELSGPINVLMIVIKAEVLKMTVNYIYVIWLSPCHPTFHVNLVKICHIISLESKVSITSIMTY